MTWTIYCHTHVESGRRFVGSTKRTWKQRWNSHVYAAKRSKGGWSRFANAIREYGKDAFSHEVLEVCDTLEEANAAEIRWIEHFNSIDPKKGFNLERSRALPKRLNESELQAKRWTIYCHTHTESGRRYVGMTSQTWQERWKNHVHAAKNSKGWGHFPNAIRKYGKDAFDHEVLEVCDTLEDANAAEEKWIAYFDTTDPEKGFNLKKGGQHTPHPVSNPWDRPGYREKSSAASRRKWEDPSFRARVTAGVTKAWQDPAHRAKMSAISKEVNSRPEVKAAISVAAASRPGKHSRFRGVSWHAKAGKWIAYLRLGKKQHHLGLFSDEEEAARRHDGEARTRLGSQARLNFPSQGQTR